MVKKCLCCSLKKSLSNFGKSKGVKRYYYRSYCKKCAVNNLIQWRNNNPEKIQQAREKEYLKNSKIYKERSKQHYIKNPKMHRSEWLKRKYGITIDEYDGLLKKQNGVCAICSDEYSKDYRKKRLSVDHCHANGKVRGLLCDRCNSGLGFFKENLMILTNAVNYLRASDS